MDKYLICMDVSGDIEKSVAEGNGLKFISMEYSFKDDMRTCTGFEENSVLKEFYDGQRGGALTKTTQINPYMYEDYFSEYMKDGYSVLYLSLSSGLSTTFESACEAKKILKQKFPGVDLYVVDTLSATGGMGVLCERAIRNRAQGLGAEDNYADLMAVRGNVRVWFMVQDLMYLKRGGRIGASTAVIGSMLNIKPILRVDEAGKLTTVCKKRGNGNAIAELFSVFKSQFNEDKNDVVYIMDADAADLGDKLAQMIEEGYPGVTVRRKMLSPIIGAHTGPGTVLACFMAK